MPTSNKSYVLAELGKLEGKTRTMLAGVLHAGGRYIVSKSLQDYLSGPRPSVLGMVTGTLKKSISQEVTSNSKELTLKVGTNVPYARYHEEGFHGVEQVHSHLRSIAGFNAKGSKLTTSQMLKIRGPIKDRFGDVVGYRRNAKEVGERLGAKGGSLLRTRVGTEGGTFDRHVNYDGRPFLRPAIDANLDRIRNDVHAGLAQIAQGKAPA